MFDLTVASSALCLALILCSFAWIAARKWMAILLPVCVSIAAVCSFLPLGQPIPFAPKPGHYTILGARIDVDTAIYALLDDGSGPPRYFRLPYSAQAAGDLQTALDGAQNGSGVHADVDGEGGVAYDGDPPSASPEPPKVPETPAVSIP